MNAPFISVAVAALVSVFIGFLWHGPVFGKMWVGLMKITPAEMEKGMKEMQGKMPYYILASFIQQLVMAYVVLQFALAWGVATVSDAFQLSFWLWLGLIATVLLNGVLWEKRTINLYLFNIVYHFVSLFVMTLIVGLWM